MQLAHLLYLLLLLHLVDSAAIPKKDVKPGHGGIKMRGPKPKKVSEEMFEETMDFEIEIADKSKKMLKVEKQKFDSSRAAGDTVSAVYGSSEVVVRVDCPDDDPDNCQQYALVKDDNETTYINNKGSALTMSNNEGEESVQYPDISNPSSHQNIRDTGFSSTRMKRAILSAGLTSSRTIKLLMFPDKGLVDTFLSIHNDDYTAAKDDIIKYLTLITNEMTIHYQTLKAHDLSMTVDGVSMPMDVAITLAGVEFPPEGTNYAWSEDNLVQDIIYSYSTPSAYTGALVDFTNFIGYEFTTSTVYDHAMAITGYDYMLLRTDSAGTQSTTNLAGTAWSGSLCKASYRGSGHHSSMNEFGGSVGRVASHELGHAFGINHDLDHSNDVDCPNYEYIMSTSVVNPTVSKADTYYKFSVCSAEDVASYTAGISTSDFEDTCLLSRDEAFLDNFCNGLLGSELSLEDQCVMAYGFSSVRLTESNSETESNLQDGYVEHCFKSDDGSTYPFRCSDPDNIGFYYTRNEAMIGTKCIAADGSKNPTNVCYNGQCMTNIEICEQSTTTELPQTTTQEPTTTTEEQTTTEEPTTTTAEQTTTTEKPTTTTEEQTTTEEPTTTTEEQTTTTEEPTTTTEEQTTTEEPTTTTEEQTTTTEEPTTTTEEQTTTEEPTTTTEEQTTTTEEPTTTTEERTTTTEEPTTTTEERTTTTTEEPTTTTEVQTTTEEPITTTEVATTTTEEQSTTTETEGPVTTTIRPCICFKRRCCRNRRNADGTCCANCQYSRKRGGCTAVFQGVAGFRHP